MKSKNLLVCRYCVKKKSEISSEMSPAGDLSSVSVVRTNRSGNDLYGQVYLCGPDVGRCVRPSYFNLF